MLCRDPKGNGFQGRVSWPAALVSLKYKSSRLCPDLLNQKLWLWAQQPVSPSHSDVRVHPIADATVSYDGESQAQKLNYGHLNSVSTSY